MMTPEQGAEFFAERIEQDRLKILADKGQEAADMFMAAMADIASMNGISAATVESALNVKNIDTFEKIMPIRLTPNQTRD